MSAPTTQLRIGIFGHVGNQNLGDESLVAAVLQNVRRLHPGAEVCGFGINPPDMEARHGIRSCPIRRTQAKAPPVAAGHGGPAGAALPGGRMRAILRGIKPFRRVVVAARAFVRAIVAVPSEIRFLAASYRALRDVDLLIIAGSQQLQDYWGGAWGHTFTLLKWSLLARVCRTKVAFLSCGAGPIETPLGKRFYRAMLSSAVYRSFRDDSSVRCVSELGVAGESALVPDLAFSLHGLARSPRRPPAVPPRIVAINPMPVYFEGYWPEGKPDQYGAYVAKLATFADWLLDAGYEVRFFPTQLRLDPVVITDVMARMKLRDDGSTGARQVQLETLDDLLVSLADADIVVATRYHGTLLSLLLERPVLCVAYHEKCRDVMRRLGQEDAVVDFDSLTMAELQQRFLAVAGRSAAISEELALRLPAIRESVDAQYTHILPGA